MVLATNACNVSGFTMLCVVTVVVFTNESDTRFAHDAMAPDSAGVTLTDAGNEQFDAEFDAELDTVAVCTAATKAECTVVAAVDAAMAAMCWA